MAARKIQNGRHYINTCITFQPIVCHSQNYTPFLGIGAYQISWKKHHTSPSFSFDNNSRWLPGKFKMAATILIHAILFNQLYTIAKIIPHFYVLGHSKSVARDVIPLRALVLIKIQDGYQENSKWPPLYWWEHNFSTNWKP